MHLPQFFAVSCLKHPNSPTRLCTPAHRHTGKQGSCVGTKESMLHSNIEQQCFFQVSLRIFNCSISPISYSCCLSCLESAQSANATAMFPKLMIDAREPKCVAMATSRVHTARPETLIVADTASDDGLLHASGEKSPPDHRIIVLANIHGRMDDGRTQSPVAAALQQQTDNINFHFHQIALLGNTQDSSASDSCSSVTCTPPQQTLPLFESSSNSFFRTSRFDKDLKAAEYVTPQSAFQSQSITSSCGTSFSIVDGGFVDGESSNIGSINVSYNQAEYLRHAQGFQVPVQRLGCRFNHLPKHIAVPSSGSVCGATNEANMFPVSPYAHIEGISSQNLGLTDTGWYNNIGNANLSSEMIPSLYSEKGPTSLSNGSFYPTNL